MSKLGRVLLAGLLLLACDPTPVEEGPIFDRVVQVRDVAATGGLVFVANDVTAAVEAPPGSFEADRLHDLILLAPSPGEAAVAGFFDAPSSPRRLFARRIAVDGDRQLAYLALGIGLGEGWVQILDVSDPAHPLPLHLLELPELVTGLGASGSLLFIASPDGLHVYDVSNPAAPRWLSDAAADDNAGMADVAVSGTLVYVAATGGSAEPIFLYPRLLVFDVSDPEHPALLGDRRIVSGFQGAGLAVVLRGSRAYLLGEIGLDVFDVSDPAGLQRLGSVPTAATLPGRLYADLEVVGDVALIATRGEGLRAVDLAAPESPVLLTTYPGTTAPGSVAAAVSVATGSAFLALSKAGVRIVLIDGDEDGVVSVVDVCPDTADPHQTDVDFDAVGDACDVCIEVADPSQTDADGDGFGNRCDPDLDGDGIVNYRDLARMKQVFFTGDAVADLDGSGVVNFADLALLKQRFFGVPGPSATALAPASATLP